MNNIITEKKNTLEGINSRITEAEERISELEDRMFEFTAIEQNKEKRMKRNEDSIRELWDNIKCTNIYIIGIPEGEEREKGPERIFEEVIVKNFPNMGKDIATQVWEVQRVPDRINPRRNTPRHTVIKLAKIKDKEQLLKSTREKQQITYKGTPIRLTADFSGEILQARREWHDIFKVMKGKNLQPRLLYSARISFRFNGEIKSFTDKQKLREFSTTKPALQ
uniref:L1 transposable element RRM domain-containing protein n=1 Tax=Phocoena sinus TaxID=42100 RepID=A0A8C9BNX8_PHOSS